MTVDFPTILDLKKKKKKKKKKKQVMACIFILKNGLYLISALH